MAAIAATIALMVPSLVVRPCHARAMGAKERAVQSSCVQTDVRRRPINVEEPNRIRVFVALQTAPAATPVPTKTSLIASSPNCLSTSPARARRTARAGVRASQLAPSTARNRPPRSLAEARRIAGAGLMTASVMCIARRALRSAVESLQLAGVVVLCATAGRVPYPARPHVQALAADVNAPMLATTVSVLLARCILP